MMQIIAGIRCALGFHDWRRSRFVPLTITGPTYVCADCRKQVNYDHGRKVT